MRTMLNEKEFQDSMERDKRNAEMGIVLTRARIEKIVEDTRTKIENLEKRLEESLKYGRFYHREEEIRMGKEKGKMSEKLKERDILEISSEDDIEIFKDI